MLHFAPRAVLGTALFDTWAEARVLWDTITAHARPEMLLLMPDHVHVMTASPVTVRGVRTAMNAFAQWRNQSRGERGRVWRHREAVKTLRGGTHLQRSERYTYLNPCRDKLARDPLSWPFSSYRDAVGFALPAMRAAVADPVSLHAYISADRTTSFTGSELPVRRIDDLLVTLSEVLAATSSLTRTPVSLMGRPGPARQLFLRAARELTHASSHEIGAAVGLSETRVRTGWGVRVPGVELVARVIGDPRFGPLEDGILNEIPAWKRYLERPSAQPGRKRRRPGRRD